MCDREDLPCEEELDSPANRRLRSTRRFLSQTPTRITPSALATRTPAHALRLAPLDAAGKRSTPDLARMSRSLTEGCDDPGNDRLAGGDGADVLYGTEGSDHLFGAAGDDRLFGELGDDRLLGDAGDDTLDGGPDIDHARGGLGVDTCVDTETSLGCP
jgi:RTX calcium-binding nonapeptide repeat (4 copies)